MIGGNKCRQVSVLFIDPWTKGFLSRDVANVVIAVPSSFWEVIMLKLAKAE